MNSIIIIVVILGILFLWKRRAGRNKPHLSAVGKAVVVTGCSSGIGRGIALYLVSKGFLVFATIRKEADAKSLENAGKEIPPCGGVLVPVCPVDLTNKENIVAAASFVKEESSKRGCQLWGVVNNAGGGWLCPVEVIDKDRFRREFETRIFGPLDLLTSFTS